MFKFENKFGDRLEFVKQDFVSVEFGSEDLGICI